MAAGWGAAAGGGALHGALAGLAYGPLLTGALLISDPGELREPGSTLLVVTWLAGIVSSLAVPIGALAGLLLGPACLLAVRRVPPPWAVPAAVALTTAAAAAVFPGVPLGERASDTGELLTLTLLPAALAGAAAWRLARRLR